MKKVVASLLLCLCVVNAPCVWAQRGAGRRGGGPGARTRNVARAADPARERREKTFALVWETVHKENFDPTFGGVDWVGVYSRYWPRVAALKSDNELHALLQQMLGEIPQSHFAIVPPELIPRVRPRKGRSAPTPEALADEGESEGDNEIATRMLNGVGVDVRVLDGRVVITRVEPGGPAERAGLRTGHVLKSVDSLPVAEMRAGADIPPELHMRVRRRILIDYLGGEPGTEVRVTYLDGDDREQRVVLRRERLKGSMSAALGNLPPLYTEFETRSLPGGIGYIRFTVFTPQLAEKICEAVKSMRDARGIIIDLRGNPGGVMGVASGVVGLLTDKAGLIGTLITRAGSLPVPAFPQKSSYGGPLVLLTDRLSGSTAEVMAAALQERGRAVVVGERSAGLVLGANIIKLPTGALFQYVRAGFKTYSGANLEGKGVTPDVAVKLDRERLLKGEDSQLQEAIRQIELRKGSAGTAATGAPQTPPAPRPAENMTGAPAATAEGKGAQPDKKQGAPALKSTPQAEAVMEKYIKAVGGREALGRLHNRVSRGTCTFPFQGLTGRVVIYEEEPDKRSTSIDIPNLGTIKTVFDGARGWMQNSLMGFYEYEGAELAYLRREFSFHKMARYREFYSELIYKGSIETAQGRVEIVEVATADGYRDELHFDSRTGFLVYGGGTELGDYRRVGEVVVPFLMKVPFMGLEIKMQLDEVSHNVPLSPEAFAEPGSCFTGR